MRGSDVNALHLRLYLHILTFLTRGVCVVMFPFLWMSIMYFTLHCTHLSLLLNDF
jgi:hypothetical protein